MKSKNIRDEDSHVDSMSIKEENSNMEMKEDKVTHKSDEKNSKKKEILGNKDTESKELNNKIMNEDKNNFKIDNNNSNNEKKSIITDNNIDEKLKPQQNDNSSKTNNNKLSNKISSHTPIVESKSSGSPKDDEINHKKNADIESKIENNKRTYDEKDNNLNNIKDDENIINENNNDNRNYKKNLSNENQNVSNYSPSINLKKKDGNLVPKSIQRNNNEREKKDNVDKIKITDNTFKKDIIIKTNSRSEERRVGKECSS